jgi:hypothetical protein
MKRHIDGCAQAKGSFVEEDILYLKKSISPLTRKLPIDAVKRRRRCDEIASEPMVPAAGLEPARPKAQDFHTASAFAAARPRGRRVRGRDYPFTLGQGP